MPRRQACTLSFLRLGNSLSSEPTAYSLQPTTYPSGFTLIEILVVIVILGIIVATATLAVGVLGQDRELEDEARRFAAVLTQAREEAELQGLDLGIFLARPAYQFYNYDARYERWSAIPDDRLFALRELPGGVRIRVWLDGREVILKEELQLPQRQSDEEAQDTMAVDKLGEDDDHDDRPQPQLIVLSTGEISPFELRLSREGTDAAWRVVGEPDSSVRVEPLDDDNR